MTAQQGDGPVSSWLCFEGWSEMGAEGEIFQLSSSGNVQVILLWILQNEKIGNPCA